MRIYRTAGVVGTVAVLLAMILVAVPIVPSISVFPSGPPSLKIEWSTAGAQEEPYQIGNVNQLQGMNDNLAASYILVNDIDASATAEWNGGEGFVPIGPAWDNPFTGSLDGQGYKITNLFVSRSMEDAQALFGNLGTGGVIKNVGLENVDITGDSEVGALVGYSDGGIVTNCYSTGSIKGSGDSVGGLIGKGAPIEVEDSYSACSVSGDWLVGGFIGKAYGTTTINNCYSAGPVVGTDQKTGGFAGQFYGTSYEGSITNCYSTSTVICVSGVGEVGGLIGDLYDENVYNCYSTGSVTGSSCVGGLVGSSEGEISRCYSTGSVSGTSNVGGLIGFGDEVASYSFWDTETSGQATSKSGTGKTTAEMKDLTTFSGATWDIIAVANPGIRNTSYIWNIVDGETYPFLSWTESSPPPPETSDIPDPLQSLVKGGLTAVWIGVVIAMVFMLASAKMPLLVIIIFAGIMTIIGSVGIQMIVNSISNW